MVKNNQLNSERSDFYIFFFKYIGTKQRRGGGGEGRKEIRDGCKQMRARGGG